MRTSSTTPIKIPDDNIIKINVDFSGRRSVSVSPRREVSKLDDTTIIINDENDDNERDVAVANPLHIQNKDADEDLTGKKDTASEQTPLISKKDNKLPQKQGWGSWAKNIAYQTGVWCKDKVVDFVMEVIRNPISSFIGSAASAQSIASAFFSALKIDPEKFTPSVWMKASRIVKGEALLNLICTLLVNVPVNKKFTQDAAGKLKTESKDMFKSPSGFFNNFLSQYFGGYSGLANGAISFSVFLFFNYIWGGIAVPTTLGVLNFIITSASRYMGLKRAARMIENGFNHEANVQDQANDVFDHLKLEEKITLSEEVAEELDLSPALANAEHSLLEILQAIRNAEADRKLSTSTEGKLNDQDYEDLYKKLFLSLEKIQALHPNLYNEKCASEYIKKYAGMLVRISFALVFGTSAGSIFMQKGFDGINLLANHSLDDWNVWAKRAIGVSAGIGSGTLYGVSASEFPQLFFIDLPTYLYRHPEQTVSVGFLIAIHYFGGSAMQGVTNGVLNRPDNILGELSQGTMKEILPYLVRAGATKVNIIGKLKEYKEDIADPFKELINHFKDPNLHRISPTTAAEISLARSKLSFYAKQAKPPAKDHDDLRHSARRGYEYAQV